MFSSELRRGCYREGAKPIWVLPFGGGRVRIKGGTWRLCEIDRVNVSRGGAGTTRHCDNLEGRLVGEGAGPNSIADLERGVCRGWVLD